MVPASILILTAATLFAKNLCRPIFAPAMTDDQVAKLARAMVVVLSVISLYLATHSSATLVSLLLLGYAGVSQFFPGVVLGLYWKRVTMPGVFAGMIAGVATVAFLILTQCPGHRADAPLLVRATCGACRGSGLVFANNMVFGFSVQ